MATTQQNAIATTSQTGTDPKFWQTLNLNLESCSPTTSSTSSSSLPRLRISRVAQLDAQLLDNELEGILHGPVKVALEGIKLGRDWQPELLAILRLTILKMSLWGNNHNNNDGHGDKGKRRSLIGDSSYGTNLQNLRFRNESSGQGESTATDSRLTRNQKLGYSLLIVIGPYLNTRLQDLMLNSSWSDEPLPRSWLSLINPTRSFVRGGGRERREEELIQWKREWKRSVWEFSRNFEKLSNLLGLINFLVFLYNGRYRSLIERVLKMRLVYSQRTVSPNVSFEYLNRQLVWEAFTEFLLFLMPLINLRRLKLKISKTLTSKSSSIITSLPTRLTTSLGLSSLVDTTRSSSSSKETRDEKGGKLSFLPSTTCPICYQLSHTTPPVTKLPSSTISASASSIADPTNPTSSITHHHSNSNNPVLLLLSSRSFEPMSRRNERRSRLGMFEMW
ncbi:hypothetical protein JCM3765_004539 [Sporobolomyces pararoseus]